MELQYAAIPIYITVGILTAIASIVSSNIRGSETQEAKTKLNLPALALLLAACVNIFHIVLKVFAQNDLKELATSALLDLSLHTLVLLLLFCLVCLWYRSMVTFMETPRDLPTPPSAGDQ